MNEIALNLFPLSSDNFTFTLYSLPFVEGEKPRTGDEEAVRRSLEVEGKRNNYWTLFQRTEGSTEVVCSPFDNTYATIAALRLALLENCYHKLDSSQFHIVGGFRHRVEIVAAAYPEGSQVVSLEPYLLRSRHQFGFLADFRFHPNEGHRGTRRALQLSLSLDRHGKPNGTYYADRYSQLLQFVKEFHSRIFPITLPGGQDVNVDTRLVELTSEQLDIKHYIVGSDSEAKSQFVGVKQNGPFDDIPNDTRLCFLYRPEDRHLSHDLFRALRGDTFSTFPGMESMFHLPLTNDRVSGIPISDFSGKEIARVADRVVADAKGSNVVSIVLTPFSRQDNLEDKDPYWFLKHAFLSRNMPVQVVANDTVVDKNKLKWSTAGIGLQVFAKAGGIPWKVRPQTERCLIVGIGQAHRIINGHIDRYFAYSVLTDSSGVFEEVKVLGEGQDEGRYIQAFSQSLNDIFDHYSTRFSSFVVHTTFSMRRRELESISDALSVKQAQATSGDFVAIKFNSRNHFFGFAGNHNSRVPYESTIVRLSRDEFLVWFDGLQYGQQTVAKMIGNPLHVQFTHPREGISEDRRRAYLQDAINLSGANWRGFNAKSLPVSVYYAQIIAKYLKEFETHNLSPIDVNTLTPWFL